MNIVFWNILFLFLLALETMNKKLQVFDQLIVICSLFQVLNYYLTYGNFFWQIIFFISGVTLPLLLLVKNDNLKSIWLSPYSAFHFDNHKEKRLRIGLSYLHEHKFQVQFRKLLKPICSCDLDIESSAHFLLPCALFNDERYSLFSTLNFTDCSILELASSCFPQTLVQII